MMEEEMIDGSETSRYDAVSVFAYENHKVNLLHYIEKTVMLYMDF